ncbi:MAG: hypothetical protein IIZ86_02820 [Firmicutes bacterium]|nr:hypothetical protein [Bacillota bacterium]
MTNLSKNAEIAQYFAHAYRTPGFLNDHSGQFAWIPFDCKESFPCVLCTHKDDQRPSLKAFLDTLKTLYANAVAFPL